MSGADEDVDDVVALRQALKQAQEEMATMRQEMAEASARQEALQRSHEEAVNRIRQDSDHEVIVAALKAEAVRFGAHNPDDVVRLIDLGGLGRDDTGVVTGLEEALEQARRERAYLFGNMVKPGSFSGNTMGVSAPRPGEIEPFDARSASETDYETRKWQFLAQG
ncbi:phage scaffolding protein [Gluconobacter morbifer]|uniref:Phage minor structural protein GP20 n=1 Tax=Gluconobacter morbifer G707 TaxID=1088869 RepID=G6XMB0_9PROT|nr:hypothetical protein [Gluconobacter morbifer]EHH67008.1 phage minor structural protein GP20 [Gluconobacter morbifer G707]